jgi:nicotinamidase-related amidase
MGETVFLVMDVQNGVIERMEDMKPYLDRLSSVIRSAREAGFRIIHIRTVFRPGFVDASPQNKSIAKVVAWGILTEGSKSAEIHDAIVPDKSDVIINKSRGSAFHGCDLETVLRSLDVETIVITGLTTSGVVLSTVRQAADMDYRLVVLEDLCKDRDPESHDILVRKIFPKQAEVLSSAKWLTGF